MNEDTMICFPLTIICENFWVCDMFIMWNMWYVYYVINIFMFPIMWNHSMCPWILNLCPWILNLVPWYVKWIEMENDGNILRFNGNWMVNDYTVVYIYIYWLVVTGTWLWFSHSVENNHPNWHIFQRSWNHQPEKIWGGITISAKVNLLLRFVFGFPWFSCFGVKHYSKRSGVSETDCP